MKYNTSIIIPYYEKYEEFKFALELNKDQYSLVKEVIIVFDQIIDISQFSFLLNYNINFKFYTNTETHEWRNPAPVINHGLKMASSEYCIILSPETILSKDAIKYLMDNVDENTFCIGQVIFLEESKYHSYENKADILDLFRLTTRRNKDIIGPIFFGSICCSKANFEKVNYYTETFINWGGEDDDVREKLIKYGINVKKIKDVKMIHIEDQYGYNKRLSKARDKNINPDNLYKNFLSISPIPNNKQIFIDSINKIGEIIDYSLNDKIYSYYPIVLLTQSYNEENNACEFIENVSSFVDGIIVLDDNSTDNTWNLLKSDKLLLKAKKDRITFNDLQNRNLLLNILENVFIRNNINVSWFIWLDFDERIDTNIRFIQYLRKILLNGNNALNIYNVPLIHMWDHINYNRDYPYTYNGVQYHTRLIKNIIKKLPYSINNKNKLHFNLAPYDDNIEKTTDSVLDLKNNTIRLPYEGNYFPLLIKHIGRQTESLRRYKYDLYTKAYDTDLTCQYSYDHFLQNDVSLLPYEENKYKIPFLKFNSLIPIIIFNTHSNKIMNLIYKKLIFSIKLDIDNNLIIPTWVNSKEHIIISLIDNPNKSLMIKQSLSNKNIQYIGCDVKSINDIINSNKLYLKRIKNRRFKNRRTFYIGALDGLVMGIIENNTQAKDLTDTNIDVLKSIVTNVYNRHNCRDYILVKLIMSNNLIMIHHINANPILSEDSIMAKSAYYCGISHTGLINKIFNSCYNRANKVFIC
jgi:hypothetical protein